MSSKLIQPNELPEWMNKDTTLNKMSCWLSTCKIKSNFVHEGPSADSFSDKVPHRVQMTQTQTVFKLIPFTETVKKKKKNLCRTNSAGVVCPELCVSQKIIWEGPQWGLLFRPPNPTSALRVLSKECLEELTVAFRSAPDRKTAVALQKAVCYWFLIQLFLSRKRWRWESVIIFMRCLEKAVANKAHVITGCYFYVSCEVTTEAASFSASFCKCEMRWWDHIKYNIFFH